VGRHCVTFQEEMSVTLCEFIEETVTASRQIWADFLEGPKQRKMRHLVIAAIKFLPVDGGSLILRSVDILSHYCTVSQPRRRLLENEHDCIHLTQDRVHGGLL
jgi:hypothetical protein